VAVLSGGGGGGRWSAQVQLPVRMWLSFQVGLVGWKLLAMTSFAARLARYGSYLYER